MATREQAYQHALGRFSEHVATYKDYGELAVLNWQKLGRKEYSIRYVFDKVGNTLSIAGDLGEAVLSPTCKCDLENCARSFRNSIDYFAEKIYASSDMYVYDEAETRAGLRERLLHDDMDDDEKKDREDLIDEIMRDFDRWQGIRTLDDDTSNQLTNIDPDVFEFIGSLGQHYHLRVYLWMFGLQFAWEQLQREATAFEN